MHSLTRGFSGLGGQVEQLAQAIQSVVEKPVQIAFVDQGYTEEHPAQAAAGQGIELKVVMKPSEDSHCYHDVGSWDAPLLGQPVSGDWFAITNVFQNLG